MAFRPTAWEVVWWPKKLLDPEHREHIKAVLTLSNGAYFAAKQRGAPTTDLVAEHRAFLETPTLLGLPRHAPWAQLDLPAPKGRPSTPNAGVRHVAFTRTLRKDQREAWSKLVDHLQRRADGILSLSCGKGKTVISILGWACFEEVAPRALAIVPTLQIAEQWKTRLLEFTDLEEEEIGLIGGGRCDLDRLFTIATVQTLSQKFFEDAFYESQGVIFFDEVHRLGAETFGRVASLFQGTRIGLSATWERADGMEKFFMLHIGAVFHEDREQALKPACYTERTNVQIDLSKYRMWYGPRRGEINFAKVITTLAKHPVRQQQTVRLIRALAKEGRKVLVLGDRKEELAAYEEALRAEFDVGLCVGSLEGRAVSQEARDAALQRQIVLATAQLVKEGLDQADLDTLIILYPKSNAAFAEQAAGRILRTHHAKQDPLVVVFDDGGCFIDDQGGRRRPFSNMCRNMMNVFHKLGYEVHEHGYQSQSPTTRQ